MRRYLVRKLSIIFLVSLIFMVSASYISVVKCEWWSEPIQLTFNDVSDGRTDSWMSPSWSISGNGNMIAFNSDIFGDECFEIFVVNSDGTGLSQLTFNNGSDYAPSISDDGRIITFTSKVDGDWEIFVVNSDGTGLKQLTFNSAEDLYPSISGDGEKIAFHSNVDGDYEIFVVNSDGSGLTQLTSSEATDAWPSISGDGKKIAYQSNLDGDYEIFLINSDGTDRTQLTFNYADDYAPSIDYDGSIITFISILDGDWEIFVVNSDGTGLKQLTSNKEADMLPVISGDGEKIAFVSNLDGTHEGNEIFFINSDGTGLTRLTSNTASDIRPSISRDGSRIAFQSDVDGDYEIYLIAQDIEAPVTIDDYNDQWHTTNFTITLNANDDVSGVAETYYKINDGPTRKVNIDGQPVITTETPHNKLEYWSVDNAGNEEEHKFLTALVHIIPVAVINGPYSGEDGESIAFSSKGSYDPDGIIVEHSWDFGDGHTSNKANPSHAYSEPGTYTVTLTVRDNEGATGTATALCTIIAAPTPAPQSPMAEVNGPYSGEEDESISFSSKGSHDPDGYLVEYRWEFGDGQISTIANPSHTYSEPGTYSVTLKVTDNQGATDTSTITCIISLKANLAPISRANGPYRGKANEVISFSSEGSQDPDGYLVEYRWEFGDGAVSYEENPTYTYANKGNYIVKLTVTDDKNEVFTDTTVCQVTASTLINDIALVGGGTLVGASTAVGYFLKVKGFLRTRNLPKSLKDLKTDLDCSIMAEGTVWKPLQPERPTDPETGESCSIVAEGSVWKPPERPRDPDTGEACSIVHQGAVWKPEMKER